MFGVPERRGYDGEETEGEHSALPRQLRLRQQRERDRASRAGPTAEPDKTAKGQRREVESA